MPAFVHSRPRGREDPVHISPIFRVVLSSCHPPLLRGCFFFFLFLVSFSSLLIVISDFVYFCSQLKQTASSSSPSSPSSPVIDSGKRYPSTDSGFQWYLSFFSLISFSTNLQFWGKGQIKAVTTCYLHGPLPIVSRPSSTPKDDCQKRRDGSIFVTSLYFYSTYVCLFSHKCPSLSEIPHFRLGGTKAHAHTLTHTQNDAHVFHKHPCITKRKKEEAWIISKAAYHIYPSCSNDAW